MSIFVEFHPYSITVNIDLLDFYSIACAEIKHITGLEGVFVIAVKNKLKELASVSRLERNIWFSKEADNIICAPVIIHIIHIFIFIGNFCNRSIINKTTFSNYISTYIGNTQGFRSNIIIEVIVEPCKVSCTPILIIDTRCNLSSDLIGSWICNLLEGIEPE
ncbi:hypothetical protein SDC9_130247 [bioreactor metagenome]|uniref:Uncharacterized protein n=1 Tax=bioreactor metagenome TaxID=1076179 RepID=A0A645D1P7_9ZZZZ